MAQPVRLQKHLARAGIASRRAAENVILEGRVRVNGRIVRELGVKVDPDTDRVQVDGRELAIEPARWIALNKPRGYVSTRHDPEGRRTVYDLLPPEQRRLFTVGRLDTDSEGLLLFTNDGDTAHRLLHPRFGVRRVYLAEVSGVPTEATIRRLRTGVQLEDGLARVRSARLLKPRGRPAGTGHGNVSRVHIEMGEGRKREVRRMLEAVGHNVSRLRRVSYGPIRLNDLPPGHWRLLTMEEIAALERRREPARGRPPRTRRSRDSRTG